MREEGCAEEGSRRYGRGRKAQPIREQVCAEEGSRQQALRKGEKGPADEGGGLCRGGQ